MNKQLLTAFSLLTFLFFSSTALATIDWVGNMFPASGSSNTIVEGENFTIYVQVYKAGTTEAGGQGAGINCEIYFGEVTAFGQPWMNISSSAMSYNVDIGNNDEYVGILAPNAGSYEFTCRCSDDGGASWTFASLPSGNGMLTVNAPLPVELIDWKAFVQRDAIALYWETASETNSSHFDIQRSADLTDWQTVATLAAKGNTKLKQSYHFLDEKPLNGTSYYRLHQVDFNGSAENSEILAVQFKPEEASLKISPNPTHGPIRIEVDEEIIGRDHLLQLYNSSGQLLLRQEVNSAINEMEVGALPSGLYLVRLTDHRGQTLTLQRVLKQ